MSELGDSIMFSNILSEQDSKQTLNKVLASLGKGESFNKTKTQQFLKSIKKYLQDNQTTPKSKFYTLYMLREITMRTEVKVLSVISAHPILKFLRQKAKQIDPNKSINQKGRTLFPDKQLGNDYIRLILQTLKFWGQKYRTNKQQKPTQFRTVYDQLYELNIVMPTEFKFYSDVSLGSVKAQKKVSSNQLNPSSSVKGAPYSNNNMQTPKDGDDSQYKNAMDYSLKKINNFLEILRDEEDYQLNCHSYHKLFTKEAEKYEGIISNLINAGHEKATNRAIALNDFYRQQASAYKQFLTNNDDYPSYVSKVQFKAGELLENLNEKSPATYSKKQSVKKQYRELDARRNNLINQTGSENKDLASNLMNKLNEKQNAPLGFKSIKQSLSKDKSFGKSKRSISGLKKSSVSKFGKSISKSKVAQIFSAPPNSYPRDKRYEGQLIQKSKELENVMKNLSRHQGIRRFITCNFKPKNPLFQNSHLQIGIKSEPIYEEINEFKVLIGIELYIGNKTEDLIKNISIDYKGNSDVLLYGNPRTIETILEGGYQSKHELLVVPLNYQFPFIKMNLKYSVNGDTVFESISLPNSIVKLAANGKLSKKQFVQHWNASTIYKTKEFKLTRYIPPDCLNKHISSLQELSSYQQFLIKGSETDFELGCQVILKQRYEGVLRISVRPNLNVVIQVGVSDNNEQAQQSFIFYAQTLQMLLTHSDHEL